MKLTNEQINEKLNQLKDWYLDKDSIRRDWEFKDFIEAIGFLNKVAVISEKHNHHAEIFNIYNKVSLRFNTHDAGGITDKDFKIALDINKL